MILYAIAKIVPSVLHYFAKTGRTYKDKGMKIVGAPPFSTSEDFYIIFSYNPNPPPRLTFSSFSFFSSLIEMALFPLRTMVQREDS